ncbi:MAG: hypothetical protein ACOYKJ_05685 [Candidatus Howiella sp.]|jgi:hypothetical protein
MKDALKQKNADRFAGFADAYDRVRLVMPNFRLNFAAACALA